MNPWIPSLTPHQRRRVGKSVEELGELLAVFGRLQIQGIDEIDPSSGKTNRLRMMEETADVYAQLGINTLAFDMDQEFIKRRIAEKIQQMHDWEAHFK